MKINTTLGHIETSGIADVSTFGIKTSAAAFQLLSSGLYTNKIMAVLREIGCNAIDAQKLNGNDTKPIEVKLPNTLDPQFYIRDFGPGLSHDNILRLYSTYFESTKQTSNEMIGGFGIGSKSPFAYTDTFTVVSIHKGIKNTYAAFVNEEGVPTIATMGMSTPSAEPDGLSVGFPVKPEDFNAFEQEAINVFTAFPVMPTILGSAINLEAYKNIHIKNNIYLLNKYSRQYTSSINMGGVRYPLTDLDGKLKDFGITLNHLGYEALYAGIEIHLPIGSVSVAASREALQYDKKTLNTLEHTLNNAGNIILQFIYDKTTEAITLYKHPIDRAIHVSGVLKLFRGAYQKHFNELFGNNKEAMAVYNDAQEGRYILDLNTFPHIDASNILFFNKYDILNSINTHSIDKPEYRKKFLNNLKRRHFIESISYIKLPLSKTKEFSMLVSDEPLHDLTLLSLADHIIKHEHVKESIILCPSSKLLKNKPTAKNRDQYNLELKNFHNDVDRLKALINVKLTYITMLEPLSIESTAGPKTAEAVWGIPIHERVPTTILKRTLRGHASSGLSILLNKLNNDPVGYVLYDRKESQTSYFEACTLLKKQQFFSQFAYKHSKRVTKLGAPNSVYMIDKQDIQNFKKLHPNAIDYEEFINMAPTNVNIQKSFELWLSERRPELYLSTAACNWREIAEKYNLKYGALPDNTILSKVYKKWMSLISTKVEVDDGLYRDLYSSLMRVDVPLLTDINTEKDVDLLTEYYPYIKYFNNNTPIEIKLLYIQDSIKKEVILSQNNDNEFNQSHP